MQGQPMNQATNSTNIGLSKNASRKPSHTAPRSIPCPCVPSMPQRLSKTVSKTVDKLLTESAEALSNYWVRTAADRRLSLLMSRFSPQRNNRRSHHRHSSFDVAPGTMVEKVQREFSPAGRKSKVSTPVVIRYSAAVITPAQIKAARALLRWDQTLLALEAGLSPFMIKNI